MATTGTLAGWQGSGVGTGLKPIASAGNFVSFATAIPEVILIQPTKFGDNRGYFAETYNAEHFHALGVDATFVQDNQSLSVAIGTVRGLHFQLPPVAQAKLIRVLRGSLLDVAVDIRPHSPTYGRHVKVMLSAQNFRQLYIPAGFAHGFVTLEPDTEVAYKVSNYYSPKHERGIAFDDPALAIEWGITRSQATMSAKDKLFPCLHEIEGLLRLLH